MAYLHSSEASIAEESVEGDASAAPPAAAAAREEARVEGAADGVQSIET